MILPTGFGKSFIYQSIVWLSQKPKAFYSSCCVSFNCTYEEPGFYFDKEVYESCLYWKKGDNDYSWQSRGLLSGKWRQNYHGIKGLLQLLWIKHTGCTEEMSKQVRLEISILDC